MSMNTQGRPTGIGTLGTSASGSALLPDEPLLFEIGDTEHSGVDLPEVELTRNRLGGFGRKSRLDLAGLTEPEAMRHYVRLSRLNHSIDSGMYPLGSCTMKHNPRLNEKMARLPGFSDIHPLQPVSTVQGALELMNELSHWLMTLTNTAAVALSPKAGAHGELLGMMAIKAAQESKGDAHRTVVLVPESAHGTNPATAAFLGYTVKPVPAKADGTVDVEAVKAALSPEVAAIMLTNPNTCGLFEPQVIEIARAVHEAGAFFYCDGANFNAIMGVVRPGDLGIDAMHINLHKTFSTPHGGGGPGAGPVVLSEALAPFAPVPFVRKGANGLDLVEHIEDQALGRVTAFHGQMGMYVRALTYMLSHGADGLAQAAEDAVLNANYIKARLQDVFSVPFPDYPTMHEALFDDSFLKGTGVTTLDFAKAMIDEGFHPMTMYFPLVVHGAMLVEPTESESKQTLDRFCDVMAELANDAKAGNTERFTAAPLKAPRRRLDETRAARQPVLKWEKPVELPKAAE
ncbi:aminomethyl-transferring glycine dehydrogenase subunit GcvPB [Devosia sp. 63-57]|uniref:aminomethyl-transferring glycine dehydrogenase subunit GcvPB n=1 Tax=Devosia sp. 63-57 TaxID=1895751 RepID=UPI00086CF8F5|nr:aminomethyl-transferring glycine dehydrogenase subunit GcvPB [Devosia sp. 63-57]ODT47541.1 MAG: glycine dehydrogenase (aminomethyl-transferring) [Pelagibacterium sp. SCN 63-126]ODU86354.1 MAG: glycine dehydrogenase (aminomethyl-transferring) [Pelagibacterium sp. SCN 63-17]OJX42751.1 MAG: glycine dehydrogenase (aminomethyl-transferring) [Devosia sp. 63-57]